MKKEDIAEALGSSRTVAMENNKLDGPLTYLKLIREASTRISIKIGRPTDVRDTKYHNIPLTDEVWEELRQKAKIIPGKRTLSASHLASFLIEEGLRRLDAEVQKYGLESN